MDSIDNPRAADKSSILGIDLGLTHFWWAQLMPDNTGGARWEDAGRILWSTSRAREFFAERRERSRTALAVVEFPDERRGGYGYDRSVSCAGALLELAGNFVETASAAGMRVLRPYVSDIRRWAAGQSSFDWQHPDLAIENWFRNRGASEECFKRNGPLSNRDKRDAMLAAEYGAARARATD